MNDIITQLSELIDKAIATGCFSLRNICIYLAVAVILVIMPSRSLKRIGLIMTLVATVVMLLVFIIKVAHLDTLL